MRFAIRHFILVLFGASFCGSARAEIRVSSNAVETPFCSANRLAPNFPDIRVEVSPGSSYNKKVSASYLIRSNLAEQNKFYVLINPQFRDRVQTSQGNTYDYQQPMVGKLQYCLTQANRHFFRPSNPAEAFEILVSEEAPRHEITLQSMDRSNYKEWDYSADCALMVHEVMHILGLPDEYFDRDFPRRVVYSASIMKSDENFFWDTVGYTEAKMMDCSVPLSPQLRAQCLLQLDRVRSQRITFEQVFFASESNRMFTSARFVPGTERFLPLTPWKDAHIFRGPRGMQNQPRRRVSLLREPHFDAILYPGCIRRAPEFYRDAARAYIHVPKTLAH